MPELLTKHPEIALQVLKSADIQCGKGKPQKILTTCPQNQFCSLPGGELCIYGTNDLPAMKQIHGWDLLPNLVLDPTFVFIFAILFLAGIFLGVRIGTGKRK